MPYIACNRITCDSYATTRNDRRTLLQSDAAVIRTVGIFRRSWDNRIRCKYTKCNIAKSNVVKRDRLRENNEIWIAEMKVHKRLQLLGRKICVFFLTFVDFKARIAIKRTPSRFYVRYAVLSSLVGIKEKTEKTERFSVKQFTCFLVSIITQSYSLLFFQCIFYLCTAK